MNVSEAINGQRAVCEFTAEPVKEELLRQLIDAAIQAPSTVNQQRSLVTIVTDPRLLARLRTRPARRCSERHERGLSRTFGTFPHRCEVDILYGASVLIVTSAARGPGPSGTALSQHRT